MTDESEAIQLRVKRNRLVSGSIVSLQYAFGGMFLWYGSMVAGDLGVGGTTVAAGYAGSAVLGGLALYLILKVYAIENGGRLRSVFAIWVDFSDPPLKEWEADLKMSGAFKRGGDD